jgi:magnesium transporter
VAVRGDWTAAQALRQVRRFGKDSETINVLYVVEKGGRLVDDIRIREVLLAEPRTRIRSLLDGRFIALKVRDDQETAVNAFREYGRVSLPVTDSDGVLLGIVTIDDVLNVAEREATEDIQKLGGVEALDEPYVDTPFWTLIKKRARWLVLLFVGEMFTATAMGHYEREIAKAVVLALRSPYYSSGGNSGTRRQVSSPVRWPWEVTPGCCASCVADIRGSCTREHSRIVGFVRVSAWESL